MKTFGKIEIHNAQNGGMSSVGINHMADWTTSEFKKILGYKPELKTIMKKKNPIPPLDEANLADSVNWVN